MNDLVMTALHIREDLDKRLTKLDESTLRTIHAIVVRITEPIQEDSDKIVGYEVDGTPITVDELLDQLSEMEKEIEDGTAKMIPAKDVFKRIDKWLSTVE